MGHKGGVYSTTQLKRYPGPLCSALANIAVQTSTQIDHAEGMSDLRQDRVEPVLQVASELKAAYDLCG